MPPWTSVFRATTLQLMTAHRIKMRDELTLAAWVKTRSLHLGRIVGPGDGECFLFSGAVDDVRIYNRALNDEQVAELSR